VELKHNARPTTAAAGVDQFNCADGNFMLAGNTPVVGNGSWSLVSGTANIENPGATDTKITGVSVGSPVILRWTNARGHLPLPGLELRQVAR
jgi:hypothetical protein